MNTNNHDISISEYAYIMQPDFDDIVESEVIRRAWQRTYAILGRLPTADEVNRMTDCTVLRREVIQVVRRSVARRQIKSQPFFKFKIKWTNYSVICNCDKGPDESGDGIGPCDCDCGEQ